jgi:hypothetical protein
LEAGTRPGNPLVSLAIAAIKAVLYVLDQSKNLVTWCTLTFPGLVIPSSRSERVLADNTAT